MAYSRVDFIVQNEDLMPHLYEAGFRDLWWVLRLLIKFILISTTREQVRMSVLKLLKSLQNKILCNGLFIVDHRFSKQDFRNMYDFIRMSKIYWCVFAILHH